jgi:hypothetical protein
MGDFGYFGGKNQLKKIDELTKNYKKISIFETKLFTRAFFFAHVLTVHHKFLSQQAASDDFL